MTAPKSVTPRKLSQARGRKIGTLLFTRVCRWLGKKVVVKLGALSAWHSGMVCGQTLQNHLVWNYLFQILNPLGLFLHHFYLCKVTVNWWMTGRIILSLHVGVTDWVKLNLSAGFSLRAQLACRGPALSMCPHPVLFLAAWSCPCVTPSLVLTQLSVGLCSKHMGTGLN